MRRTFAAAHCRIRKGSSSIASENEGEGSRTAAKEYNERTKQFVEKGEAEAKGRAHAHEEDPQVRREK